MQMKQKNSENTLQLDIKDPDEILEKEAVQKVP